MAKRITRMAARVAGLGPIARSGGSAGSLANTGFRNARPNSIPQGAYNRRGPITPITGGYAAVLLDISGGGRAFCGPQGVGTIWYPQAVAINTTTGANDASTCALYLSPMLGNDLHGFLQTQSLQFQIAGQSYAGGGDTIGLAVPPMWPGYYIIAVWSGGIEGDVASLQVYGNQTVLMT